MGAAFTREPSGPAVPVLAVPAIDRETSTLDDKEARATMDTMEETMKHTYAFATDADLRASLLADVDNSDFAGSTFQPARLPRDAEGYVLAFDSNDAAGIKTFFDTYGVVVVRDVLTKDEADRSVDETWDAVERLCTGVDRSDPSTWDKWCSLAKLGFLGGNVMLGEQYCRNRENPRVLSGFAALFQTDELHVSVGRAGIMRPTKDLVIDGTVTQKPEWRTAPGRNWLHWDMNPWTGAATTLGFRLPDPVANRGFDRLHVQGLISLASSGTDDGGFFCVPGSHRHMRSWAHAHRDDPDARGLTMNPASAVQTPILPNDPLKQHAEKVEARAGSLVLWNTMTVHSNYSNWSPRPRVVQYIRMHPVEDPTLVPLFARTELLPPRSRFEPSLTGAKLLGLQSWR